MDISKFRAILYMRVTMWYSFSKAVISLAIRDKKMRCSTKASTVSAILSSFREACYRRDIFVSMKQLEIYIAIFS